MFHTLIYAPNHPVTKLMEVLDIFFYEISVAGSCPKQKFPQWFQDLISRCGRAWDLMSKVVSEINRLSARNNSKCRRLLLLAFQTDRDVKTLCLDASRTVVSLRNLPVKVRNSIDVLFEYLYSDLLATASFRRYAGGNFHDHYDNFLRLNRNRPLCPFCSLIQYPSGARGRAPYDHFLCKVSHPLNVVNFENLVPICTICNGQGAKGQKNVLLNNGGRRRVAYPYGSSPDFVMTLSRDVKGHTVWDDAWKLIIAPQQPQDSDLIDAWLDIFQIQCELETYIRQNCRLWIFEFAKDCALFGQNLHVPDLQSQAEAWAVAKRGETYRPAHLLMIAYFGYIASSDKIYATRLCQAIRNNGNGWPF